MLTIIITILILVIFLLDALALVTWQASLSVLGFVTMAVWASLVWDAAHAPEGYEDETGFHYGTKQ